MFFPSQICKGTPQHEEICLGLFTLVLTEPAQAQKVRPCRSSIRARFCSPGSREFGAAEALGGGRRLAGPLCPAQCLLQQGSDFAWPVPGPGASPGLQQPLQGKAGPAGSEGSGAGRSRSPGVGRFVLW